VADAHARTQVGIRRRSVPRAMFTIGLGALLAIGSVAFTPVRAVAAIPEVRTPLTTDVDIRGPLAIFGTNVVFGTHRSTNSGATWAVDQTLVDVSNLGGWKNAAADGKLIGYTASGPYAAVSYDVSTGTSLKYGLNTVPPTSMSSSWTLYSNGATVTAYNFVAGGSAVAVPSPSTATLVDTPTAQLSPSGAVIWSASISGHHVVAVAASPTATPSPWVTLDGVIKRVVTDTALKYVVPSGTGLQLCSLPLANVAATPTCSATLPGPYNPLVLQLLDFGASSVLGFSGTMNTQVVWNGSAWATLQTNPYGTYIAQPAAAGSEATYGDTPYVLIQSSQAPPAMQKVSSNGALSAGFVLPTGRPASVSTLGVAPDRVVGTDARDGSVQWNTAWTRPVTGSTFGAEPSCPTV